MTGRKPTILCVDDEPNVLEGLRDNLRRGFSVSVATSAQEGLSILERDGPFAVILSDMRMPGMDGSAFLSAAREAAPDTVRMLLTGQADAEAAARAVNEGQIFRFLFKPCPRDDLLAACSAAARQYELLRAERVLLEETLRGSLEALTDVLALANPVAFGRAQRLKAYVRELADALGLRERWHVEIAATLSQVGCVTLPPATVAKLDRGQDLTPEEAHMVDELPRNALQLLRHVPRIEAVTDIIASQIVSSGPTVTHAAAPLGARMLRIAVDFDRLEASVGAEAAVALMRQQEGRYDPELLELFGRLRGDDGATVVRKIRVGDLRSGMVLMDDVCGANGAVIVPRGYRVTPQLKERLRNFSVPVDAMVLAKLPQAAAPARAA